MQKVTYKGVKVNKPDNISMNSLKDFIDTLGKDYCFTVDQVFEFNSKRNLIKNNNEDN